MKLVASTLDIATSAGRGIRATELEQWTVYAGLVEGLPTDRMNRRIVDAAEREAASRWGSPVVLVPPIETPIDWQGERPYPFGVPTELPAIGVRARFWSSGPDALTQSTLTFVWFQVEWAPPVDEAVLSAIRSTDWDATAAIVEV